MQLFLQNEFSLEVNFATISSLMNEMNNIVVLRCKKSSLYLLHMYSTTCCNSDVFLVRSNGKELTQLGTFTQYTFPNYFSALIYRTIFCADYSSKGCYAVCYI